MYMFAAIQRRRSSRKLGGRSMSTVALPPRERTAASESKAKLPSSAAARDKTMAFGRSKASGSTSSSGISSTTYTSSSRGSVISSELHLRLQCIDDEEKPKRLERAKHLAKELYHGDRDVSVLGRWLSEMGVAWVLDLADDPSVVISLLLQAQPQRDNLTERWIRSLNEITESIRLMSLRSACLVPVEGLSLEEPVEFVRVLEASVLKMLPFVDALVAAADLDASNGAQQAPSEKLHALLGVRDALSRASDGIQLYFIWDSAEMEVKRSKLLSLLSAKTENRLEEAIWNTMEEVRTAILNDGDGDDDWGIQTSQGAPVICKVTRSLMTYIKSLWNNYWQLDHIVRAAAKLGIYVPNRNIISSFHLSADQVKSNPLTTLAFEMVSSLEVKLDKKSESFPDHSLSLLFLINNMHFIRQQLHPFFSMKYKEVIGLRIEECIQKYLKTSWAPVMSRLDNDTPHCSRKNTALPKFDLEFQKTYTAQKLWKVPDPELRTRLRKAIVEQVVPGLTRYLEENNITSPGVTPEERERMLLELFEG